MASIYSVFIINKSSGIIYYKDYGSTGRMDTNDSLRFASASLIWSFTFPVHADYLATLEIEDVKPMRLLMAVKVENIQTFRLQLKALSDECMVFDNEYPAQATKAPKEQN